MTESPERDDDQLTHREWANALANEETLLGQSCPNCGHVTGSPKAACARCGSRELAVVELPTAGTVHTKTTVHVAPIQFDGEDPYDVALVDVGDARLMAHVDGTVDIGDAIELVGTVDTDAGVAPVFGRPD